MVQGELQHRRLKRRYPRTSKTKATIAASIAKQDALERFCEKVMDARAELASRESGDTLQSHRTRTSPSDHYHIAQHARVSYDITSWLGDLGDDPAIKVCNSRCMFDFDQRPLTGLHPPTQRPPSWPSSWNGI